MRAKFIGRLCVEDADDPTDTPRTTVLIVTDETLRLEALFRQTRVLHRGDIKSIELAVGLALARLRVCPTDRFGQALTFHFPRWRQAQLTEVLTLRSWL